jgi:hypothetical protein
MDRYISNKAMQQIFWDRFKRSFQDFKDHMRPIVKKRDEWEMRNPFWKINPFVFTHTRFKGHFLRTIFRPYNDRDLLAHAQSNYPRLRMHKALYIKPYFRAYVNRVFDDAVSLLELWKTVRSLETSSRLNGGRDYDLYQASCNLLLLEFKEFIRETRVQTHDFCQFLILMLYWGN